MSLANALKESLCMPAISKAIDLTIDLLDAGTFNSIPIISNGVEFLQARDKLQELRFRRNCEVILKACTDVDLEKRQATIRKISSNPKLFEDFADTFMQIACDSSKPFKAQVVGNLMAKMLEDELTYETYDELVHIVHSATLTALKALKVYGDESEGDLNKNPHSQPKQEPLLLSLGIATRFGTAFRISKHGQLLYSYGLK